MTSLMETYQNQHEKNEIESMPQVYRNKIGNA